MDKPKQLTKINLEALRQACQEYVDFVDNDEEYHEDLQDDYEHEILEQALMAVFGKDIYDWVNARQP